MVNQTQEGQFGRYVDLIRSGMFDFEIYARCLVEQYGFPVEQLDSSIREGRAKRWQDCLSLIREGAFNYDSCFISRIAPFACEAGFRQEGLYDALNEGLPKRYSVICGMISEGMSTKGVFEEVFDVMDALFDRATTYALDQRYPPPGENALVIRFTYNIPGYEQIERGCLESACAGFQQALQTAAAQSSAVIETAGRELKRSPHKRHVVFNSYISDILTRCETPTSF